MVVTQLFDNMPDYDHYEPTRSHRMTHCTNTVVTVPMCSLIVDDKALYCLFILNIVWYCLHQK